MPFVKLDTGILDSSLWVDREGREVFITALCMARPFDLAIPAKQLSVREIEETGFVAPPGWYGLVEAAGSAIVRRAGLNLDDGLRALDRLGAADPESRTPDHDGRRIIRIDGGYLILNYDKYREKDHTSAARSKRLRDKRKAEASRRDERVATRSVTQAEAEAEAEAEGDLIPPTEAPPKVAKAEAAPSHEAFRLAWNSVAVECGLVPCRSISPGRRRALKERLKDPDWRRNYPEALQKIRGIRWLRGENTRGWRANVDWFLRPDALIKILEGGYEDSTRQLACKDEDDSAGLF